MLETEKMESKKLKTFHKLLEWISSSTIFTTQSRQAEQAEPGQKRECLRGN